MKKSVCAGLWLGALLWTGAPGSVQAWSPEGHAMVSEIAERFLTPRARQRLKAILEKRKLADYEVASWPDIIRGNKEYAQIYPQNGRWHYVDFDAFAPLDELRLPEDGQDVVSQVVYWHKELSRKYLRRARRLDALCFLVHFVGDMHQPLHCASRYNDVGGNMLPVHSFVGAHFTVNTDIPMEWLPNLHSVWDGCFIYELMNGLLPEVVAGQLADEITPEQVRQWTESAPLAWALESHTLARSHAYRFTDGTDLPFTWSRRPGMDLTRENYIDANVPVVREQLQKAGVRLAHLLNTALDHSTP